MSDEPTRVHVPDPENVPAEQRTRRQWLMWDDSANAPRRPHWRGDFGVSWTDPDDWHSFEEAREAAQERDSWGVGYVFARTNEDAPRGLYGALDLDGCAGEDGTPKEWLPSLAPFADHDASIEWSPSGTGLHIPLAGFEPPEWWSDCHFTDDEHEGVEAYGSKFFTVTGNRLRNSGEDVADTGEWVEEWLAQAHKSIMGDDPRECETEGGSSGSMGGVSAAGTGSQNDQADPERVEEALGHIDPDVGYPKWRDIGFALDDEFPASTALSLFKNWSRSGTKWDTDAERRAERIINDATRGGGRSIGTVFHFAKESGWSPSRSRTPMTAQADGGSTVAAPSSDTDTDSPSTPDGTGGGGDKWRMARELFASGERGTTGEAKQMAAMRLLEEFELLTVEENNCIWQYHPDTGVFTDDGRPRLRKRLGKALGSSYSRSRVTDILHRIRSETYVKRDSLGAPDDLLCVANGVFDLSDPEAPELMDHSPEYRFTWAMNAPYDPDAEASEFRAFLGDSVRPEDIPKLQEYAGDALRHWKQPRNLCALLGPTDSGKGVFLRVLKAVFGDGNVASETLEDLTDTRWGANSLLHRPLNLANELSTGSLDSPERAKNFSGGGDTVSAEEKGEAKYELTPVANHIFATNQVPQVSNADDAFYNRWLFASFPETVPTEEQDDTLDDRIIASDEERAGILNWLIEGYTRRQMREGTGFVGERSIAEKEDMWSAYGDSLDRFVSTCITTEDATGDDVIAKQDIYEIYKTMCNEVGVSIKGQGQLTVRLKKEEGIDDGRKTTDAEFTDSDRPRSISGVQLTDDGKDHRQTAIDARETAKAREDFEEDQRALEGEDWENADGNAPAHEISQEYAINALIDSVDQLTDEQSGSVHVDDVVNDVAHTEKKARHIIDNLLANGTLIEDPEDHIELT